MKRSIIKVKDLSFNFNDKKIIDNLTLNIYEGSFNIIVGKNGSGKTTFLKLLAALYKGEGYITIDGYLLNNYFEYKIKRNISFCFGNNLPFDTARDALAFPLESLQYSKKEIIILIDRISKKFKIERILDKSLDEITQTEKIKVEIAASIIHNPKIIVLDNILCYLSDNDKRTVLEVLKEYKKEKKLTIILTTTDLEDTLLGDRIIVFDKGSIIMDDTPSEIYKNDYLEKLGFNLPLMVELSNNLILYDLLDKVCLKEKEVLDKLWP